MFKLGRKHGFGVYKYRKLADEYHANWEDDLLHGKCKILFGNDKDNGLVNMGDLKEE
jgi:MORN repeat